MSDIADTIVLSPFFEPNSSKDFEKKLNVNEGEKEAFSSHSQAEENFTVKNFEKVNDTVDHVVLSPFFQHSSSENEEEDDTNLSICGDKIESSSSQAEIEDEKGVDLAVCKNKNGSSSSRSEENFRINSGRLSSDIPVKIEREEQPIVKFTSCEDKNEFCSSQDEEKLKLEHSGVVSDFIEPVTHSPFFGHSLSGDIAVKKESKEKPDVCWEVENELSTSQGEKKLEIKNSGKINDITNFTIPNPSLCSNLSNNIAVTTRSRRKANVKCNSEIVSNFSSSPGEEYARIENSGKMNSSTDSVIPSPFFYPSHNSESMKSKKELNVEFPNCEGENESSNEPSAGIKSVSKNTRKPRKRHSTMKKDPGHKKVVTSPYFAAEANSPEEDSGKSGEKQRKGKKWIPPRSPYALIQEDLFDKPWQLLIATIFLTKTRGQLAIPYIHKFLGKWPTPESLLEANFEEVHEIFQPLGLGMVRSCSVFRFTKEFLEKDWSYPIELHGIGKYGNDSYRMFCVNEWREVTPTDIPLSMYREWLTANQEKLGLR